MGSELLRYI